MRVNINSVHFKTDKKLDNFITEKLEKIRSLHDGIIGSEVTLKLENGEHYENKIAEIKLLIPGNDIFASKQNRSFEEAFDGALEALKKQLNKRKEKQRGE